MGTTLRLLVCTALVRTTLLFELETKEDIKMGNAQARRRLNAKDFQYITNNTALLNMQMVTEYFNDLTSKYPDGKMDVQDFKKIFQLAFPERKEAKVDQLAEKLRNVEKTDGKIPLFTIAMLLFWFSDGPLEENLAEMFKLFDEDGNGNISIDELLNMMAFFIELGMDTGNVDMAKTMAEVFSIGDINRDEKLSKVEFVQGMKQHPVTSKLLNVKKIDDLLATFCT